MADICLVTGASGFVGSAFMTEILSRQLSGSNLTGRGVIRRLRESTKLFENCLPVGDIDGCTVWNQALSGVSVVVHTAARAHVLREMSEDPLAEFRKANVEGTLNLAKQAMLAGVRRFIFISSVGVNGNQTFGRSFTCDDLPNPREPYAISKLEAELALRELFCGSMTELVIVRPPLVYGLGAPGNFASLMRAVQRGWPLPLGAVPNQRSLVALDNLVDFIMTCVTHPLAANQTFLVSDGQDLSTTELVRGMAKAAGVPARLLPVPVSLLRVAARLIGKTEAVDRLCGNLQVDISKARNLLGWVPPISVSEGLRRAVEER